MTDAVSLFSSAGFMPHGMCYLWRPDILALHVTSDGLISLAYFSIPFTLLYFVRARRDLEFHWMFVCFAVFIVACGATHLLEIWSVWQPVYWLSGTVKAITALASVTTAYLLVRLVPQALRLPSPAALRIANEKLSHEIGERRRAEDEVRRANTELEARVAERTQSLRGQIARLALLDQSTRAIAERQDLRSIFQVAIRSLEEHLPVDFGCIALYEPAAGRFVISAVGGKSVTLASDLALTEQAQLDVDRNGLTRCARGQLVYESNFESSSLPFLARLARADLDAVVLSPLIVEGDVFAALIVARRRPAGFSSGECEFLRQLSEHLALAARQLQLYSALQRAYDDLRRTQQSVMQQERLRALGQMAGGIAHDINNALSPASLYAESMLENESALSDRARSYLTIIQRAIDDVGRTVNRMRMFYRPRELDAEPAPVNVNLTLRQVAELTRARWHDMAQERGTVIALQMALGADLPPIVGVENEIRDALTNLVLNAVDAMPEGGSLTLRSGRIPSENGTADRVEVEIADTGVGMSEEVRARCLEPFFTTKGERGTGLGLAMVYGMAERHDALLAIESIPGGGTSVRILFPTWTAPPIDVSQAPGATTKPLRVLLVDDDPLLLKSLRDVLASDGHTVVAADNGQHGIDEFLRSRTDGTPFDVVISDLGMPNIDGRKVAAAIKAVAPNVPLILLTGWGQGIQSERELARSVDKVLSKPPRIAELRVALKELTA